jgi:aryl-alcohol dehydrogenase-like predicted oxidoreductase
MAKEQRIEERLLGGSGIEVSAIGLGCMSLSGIYGASSDDDGIALIRAALDHGITLLDTSDAYGAGHNEELVGKAIKGRRSEVVLATKFGNLGGRGGKFADGRPEYAASSCEASLKRLGVETIDLYYQHRVDPMVPIEETVGAMARRRARQGARAGLERGAAGNHPPRAEGSPHCRGSKRVLVALSRRGGGDPSHDA